MSEYIHKYPKWPLPEKKKARPPDQMKNDAKFDGTTTYVTDFDKKRIPDKIIYVKPGPSLEYNMPLGQHYVGNRSEYIDRYKKHALPEKVIRKPQGPDPNAAPFDDTTTYRTDFPKHPNAARALMRPANTQVFTGPFNDHTTYKTDFAPKHMEKPIRKTPQHSIVSSGPFYGITTHMADFGPKALDKRAKPVIYGSNVFIGKGPFDPETTYHHDFKKWQIPKAIGRMKDALPKSDAKFDGTTTYNTDYIATPMINRCPVTLRPKPTVVVGDHICY